MADLKQIEFFLLRYSGDITKRESISLGVVVIAPESGGEDEFVGVRFVRNWRRLQCFDPMADMEEVLAIEREVRQDLQDPKKRAQLLQRLNDSYSNIIRLDGWHGCLTESPALELEKLSAMYLETPAETEKRVPTGRQRILNVMRDELEKAGAGFDADEYFRGGIYQAGRSAEAGFRIFQRRWVQISACDLAQRVEPGMTPAERFPQIAAGMMRKKQAKAWLTAVMDDELDRDRGAVGFALEMMRDSGIVVARVAEMPDVAQGIRTALRMR